MLGEPCGTPCLVPEHTPTSTDHVSPDEGISEASAGSVRWRDCGNQLEHQLCDVQWGAKNPKFPNNGANA